MNIMNFGFNFKLIINCFVFILIKFYEKGSYICEVNINCFFICVEGLEKLRFKKLY